MATAFTLAKAAAVNPSSFSFRSNILRVVGGPVTAFGAVAMAAGNAYVDFALAQEADNIAMTNAMHDERFANRMVKSASASISELRQKMANEKCK